MVNQQESLSALIASFTRNVNKYNEFSKRIYDLGIGIELYPAEVHTLVAISKSSGMNITEIGRKIGVTKSAASQMIIKLEKKKLVRKYHHAGNNKSLLISLTDKGKTIVRRFRESQQETFTHFTAAFQTMNEEQIHFIQYIFDLIEENLDHKLSG